MPARPLAADTLAPWADGYVGIPWRWRGRDRHGIDCHGLVMLVYREVFGLPVADFAYQTHTDGVAAIDAERRAWRRVAAPVAGDVAIVDAIHRGADGRRVRGPFHLALYAGANRALHAADGTGVVLVPVAPLRVVSWRRHGRRS